MNELLIIVLTTGSALLVVYHHLGYPLILRLVQRHQPKHTVIAHPRRYTSTDNDHTLPTITIVIPAYNERNYSARPPNY